MTPDRGHAPAAPEPEVTGAAFADVPGDIHRCEILAAGHDPGASP